MIGQLLSHYRVLDKLGGGGMGVVYRTEDEKLRRHVAIKLLPSDLTRDEEAKRRFMLEAQAASALDHPKICTIYEIDETPDGQLFLVMAYYDGQTLKTKIERGPLKLDDALDYAVQIAQGLVKAHAAGIVHRDVTDHDRRRHAVGRALARRDACRVFEGTEDRQRVARSPSARSCSDLARRATADVRSGSHRILRPFVGPKTGCRSVRSQRQSRHLDPALSRRGDATGSPLSRGMV